MASKPAATTGLKIKLFSDTGISSSDLLSSDGTAVVSGAASGDIVTYRLSPNGGSTWGAWTTTTGTIAAPAYDGTWIIQVQEKTSAGKLKASTSLTFTLDTAAAAPSVQLANDTGVANDRITHQGTLQLGGVETGATVQYSRDAGATWQSTFSASEGLNNVLVRQTDKAGNVSPSTTFSFSLDTSVAAPTVALASDTGLAGDGITQNGALQLGGVETGASAQYSHDAGATWQNTFSATEGLNSVLVRQTDVAGNVSTATALSFTLDTTAPTALNDSATTNQDTPTTIDVLANDTDTHGVAIASIGAAAHGTVSLNSDNTLTYTPGAGYFGTDSFTYSVTDAAGLSTSATVQLTVNEVPTPPPATGNTAPIVDAPLNSWTPANQALTVYALQNAWDPDGNALSVVQLPAALPAGVSFDADTQSFTFDPSAYTTPTTVSVAYGVSDGFATTLTSATFVSGASPFTALDPATVTDHTVLTDALLATGSGIEIDPESIAWHTSGAGATNLYDGSLAALGIGTGLLLTSGATPAPVNTMGWFGTDNADWSTATSANNGDATLDAVVNSVFSTVSYDATTLSFTFKVTDPNATSVSFDLVFGSDEYPEWVDQFVDCAVVVVNGVNVALFNHDPLHPLSVIGSNLAGNYFIDNAAGQLPIEYDGVSAKMKIVAPVQAGNNTIKIAIGDTGDHVYDSGIFLANFTAGTLPGTGGMLIEGSCGSAASDLIDMSGSSGTVNAGAGDDIVLGSGSGNVISGGSGSDQLVGGGGADDFDYSTQEDWGAQGLDTITDFIGNTVAFANVANTDAINGDILVFSYAVLDALAGLSLGAFTHPDAGNFSTLAFGDLSARADGQADQAHAQFVYDAATGIVGFDADGTGSAAALQVTLIGTHPAHMALTDFVIEG